MVVFGRLRPVTDEARTREICSSLCRRFTDSEEYLRHELEGSLGKVLCLELTPERITGKSVRES